MNRFYPVIIIILLLPLYLFSLSTVSLQRKALSHDVASSYVLPSQLLKITSLEFEGLVADFLFLKALTFYGGTLERKERPKTKDWEWRFIYQILIASTDLDPYFYDPYYFANANLTWDAHMVTETNTLLAKGKRHRDWDWTIPFYMGFNEFYFLKNNVLASEYLMEGSKREGAPSILATLAARLAYKGERTKIAIVFLQETLIKTKDKNTRKEMETRLKALQGIFNLERAVETYKSLYGKLPNELKDLQNVRIIAQLPDDPYGGKYYIDSNGSIKTTSDLLPMKK